MTASERAAVGPYQPRQLHHADVDHDGNAWCPVCGGKLTAAHAGTPDLPTTVLADDRLALQIESDTLPAFGYRCPRHRSDVHLFAPATVAPDTYDAVDVEINERAATVAVPATALPDVSAETGFERAHQ